jgi:Domain of unknown function (DUF4159)
VHEVIQAHLQPISQVKRCAARRQRRSASPRLAVTSLLMRLSSLVLSLSALLAVGSACLGLRAVDAAEFSFVRLQYTASDLFYGRRERWLTDWPEAEEHLIQGIRRLTRVDINAEGQQIAILDDRLFDYPWIYAVEVGGWSLSDLEARRLREYLERGGLLVVDDFHGTREWEGFASNLYKVFPDRPIVDIPLDDSVLHTVFDLDESVQIPGIGAAMRGVTYERDGYKPHWRGIYDQRGRLMVVINFNMDLGDAWEHADTPEYALLYTNLAYKYAIDYIVYAMTH